MSTAFVKRVFAGALGVLAFCSGGLAIVYSIRAFEEFWNPAVPFRLALLGELLTCSMAFAALALGMSLMRFSTANERARGAGRLRAVLLGMGCFFPGFIFSLPLTMLWAGHTWPGDGQSSFVAMEVSCYIGVAAAVICCVVLLKRHRHAQNHGAEGIVR